MISVGICSQTSVCTWYLLGFGQHPWFGRKNKAEQKVELLSWDEDRNPKEATERQSRCSECVVCLSAGKKLEARKRIKNSQLSLASDFKCALILPLDYIIKLLLEIWFVLFCFLVMKTMLKIFNNHIMLLIPRLLVRRLRPSGKSARRFIT